MTVKPKRKRALAYEPVMVSGIKLAHHFGVVRQMIDKLTAQGVISRDPSGLFDQDVQVEVFRPSEGREQAVACRCGECCACGG